MEFALGKPSQGIIKGKKPKNPYLRINCQAQNVKRSPDLNSSKFKRKALRPTQLRIN